MEIVFDTSAWIEYFIGSQKGEKVNEYLSDSKNEILTPFIVLLELSYKSEKENWSIEKYLKFIKSKSTIVGINDLFILEFGKIYNNMKKRNKDIGLADAVILTTSKLKNAQILTSDFHFHKESNAIILK